MTGGSGNKYSIANIRKRGSVILKNESNKELIFDSSLAFIIRIGAALSSFFMNVMVARYIGIKDSGNFFLALAVITILGTIVRLGGDNAVLRFIGIYAPEKEWIKVRGVIKKIFSAVLIFSLAICLALVFCSKFISISIFGKPDMEKALFWMVMAIPFLALYTLFAMALQGIKKVLFSVSVQNILTPFFLIICILIASPKNAGDMAELYLLASAVTLGISFFLWRYFVPSGKADFSTDTLWKSCYPLWIIAILQQIIQWGGQFIAGIFSDTAHLAQLAVAQRTSMLISFIGIAINLVSAPRFANLYSLGKSNELKRYAKNTTRLMIIFSTPLVIFIWMYPQFIMSLFGKGFTEGFWMLRILALGQYVNVITGSVGYLLLMSGHEKDMRNITFISGILSLILNIFFVWQFGAMGAAIAIALSIATQNLLAVRMVNKRLGFSTLVFWNNK